MDFLDDDYYVEEEFKRLLLKLPPVTTCSHCKQRVYKVFYLPIPQGFGYTVTDALCEECSGMGMVARSNNRMATRDMFGVPKPTLILP